MIALVVLLSMLALLAGYFLYGSPLCRLLGIDDSKTTPACEINDGVDYVPAKAGLLLGQHFSAISAAGPIVGPVLAGLWFGWGPALLWIILGGIFIGGTHDFSSLLASIREKGCSIGEIAKRHISKAAYVMFLLFVWLSLEYVIIAFTDITGQTFKTVSSGEAYGPGVALSSVMYILAAVAMGICLYKLKMSMAKATAIFIPLVLFIIWVGPRMPAPLLGLLGEVPAKGWDVILLLYCFVASLIPVWLLLQPRGYLGGWLLYMTLGAGLLGTLFGGYGINYPAFNLGEGLASALNGKALFPFLFITVACGACSGFHGIVSSGTTSKQIAKEGDAKIVGYGGMLLESLVAVLALATVMMFAPGAKELKGDPNLIYANGIANFMGLIGISYSIAFPFTLLAFSTFVYDTLDVATRLARYLLQELTGLKGRGGAVLATLLTVLLPCLFLLSTKEKGYLVAWPIFGASNQLLASLTLLAVSLWLVHSGKKVLFALIPMAFMLAMSSWSIVLLVKPFYASLFGGKAAGPDATISGVAGSLLMLLCVWLVVESAWAIGKALRERNAVKASAGA